VATTVAPSPSGTRRRVRVQGLALGQWLRTTPGRLRLASVVLVIGLLVLGVVAATSAAARGDAARGVGTDAAPELIAAEGLYGSLADADATASIIFLKAGRESQVLRDRYEADLRAAGDQLAVVAREAGASADERAAIDTISRQISSYAGYVETARANSRLGYPVGAAYLRRASAVMHDELLPAATTVYEHAATRLDDKYRSGTSTIEIVLVLVAGLVLVALLVGVQLFVTRRSNRILNVGLAAATVVVVILLAWTIVRFVSAQSSLVDAQRKGSDTVQLLSAARILTLHAQADENTTLIERGGGQAFVTDFEDVMHRLVGKTGSSGLIAQAREVARRTNSQSGITTLATQFADLQRLHTKIRALDDGGNYEQAVATATGQQADLVTKINATINTEIDQAKARLEQHTSDARSGFGVLAVAIPVLVLLAALLVLYGLQRRITEYR